VGIFLDSAALVHVITWWPPPQTGLWCWRRARAGTEASGWSPTSQVCSIHRWSSAGRREWWGKSPAQETAQNRRNNARFKQCMESNKRRQIKKISVTTKAGAKNNKTLNECLKTSRNDCLKLRDLSSLLIKVCIYHKAETCICKRLKEEMVPMSTYKWT